MSIFKPQRVLLLALTLLAGCAHQASRAPVVTQVVVPVTAPTTPDLTAPAPQTDAVTTAAATPAPTAPAATPGNGADLPGPPADSLVTTQQPADLFDRLRNGFALKDANEPAIDRQLNWFANHPDYLERTFGRSELWMHYIVTQLEQRHMPLELALLPVIESAYEPYAFSRASASGLWQFVSDTGRRYGLKQDWWYDGRRDAIESTRAALDYLQALHAEFNGDWLLAIAAYNCGEMAVTRAIERNMRKGKPTDFWDLKLPAETRAYVPKLLAMKRLVANPAQYGLEFSKIPDAPYFVQVKTGGQIDLQVVADLAGISKEDLYDLNPAFHRWATDPAGPDTLLVPIDAAPGLQAALNQLTPDQRMRVEHYSVAHGDTVASIARRFGTHAAVIRELNDLGARDKLVIDTSLRVPSHSIQLPDKVARAAALVDRRAGRLALRGTHPTVHVVRRGDTLYGIAHRLGTDVRTLARLNGMQPSDMLRPGRHLVVKGSGSHSSNTSSSTRSSDASGRKVTYTVRRGDTLYSIARLLQVTVVELVGWNEIGRKSYLRPGQTLVAFVRTQGQG